MPCVCDTLSSRTSAERIRHLNHGRACEVRISEQNAKLGDAFEEDADEARPEAGHHRGERRAPEHRASLRRRHLGLHRVARGVLGELLHELAVGGDRVVADGLDGGAAEVGGHVLRGRHPVLLPHLVVRRVEEERHGDREQDARVLTKLWARVDSAHRRKRILYP